MLNAFRETNDALVGVQKTREESDAQARRARALRNYARLSRARYEGGATSYIEVLYAENELFAAELNSVSSQADRLTPSSSTSTRRWAAAGSTRPMSSALRTRPSRTNVQYRLRRRTIILGEIPTLRTCPS